jgi:DNA-binding IclR family transcriptional regulator
MNKQVSGDGTVGKALEVLDRVAAFGRPVRFSDVLGTSPHPKATLYRLLQTLTNQGMLSYNEKNQTYALGLRLVRLAHSAWQQGSLAPVAAPFLDALADEVGETLHLAQMENGQVLFVDKRRTSFRYDTLAQTGRVAPAHCTGVGKAILAFLPDDKLERALLQQTFLAYTPATHAGSESLLRELDEIRRTGLAFDREEHEQGVISIAAPIRLDAARVIGAVSIATSTSRHSVQSLKAFAPTLQHTVDQIGKAAVAWQFPVAQ